jgi:hypothetical protein
MSGSDGTHHDGRGVTTERLLEHASQGTVTVGDVRSCLGFSSWDVGERTDDIAESRERHVNRVSFLQTVACSLRLVLLFRASKID